MEGKPLKYNGYCDIACPFFERLNIENAEARCKKLKKYLEFYDWFLAECDELNIYNKKELNGTDR